MNGFGGPVSGLVPGTRTPWGPTPRPIPGPWNAFAPGDLDVCYPRPDWIAQRLRDHPQHPVGNALYDPLPVPFTAEEVRAALVDVYRNRKSGPDSVTPTCARAAAHSVHIALAVLPFLEARNGGWVDFDASRPTTGIQLYAAAVTPRRGVFNLRCLLYRLPGKPLPQSLQGPCIAPQPRHVDALYNVRNIATTYGGPLLPGGPEPHHLDPWGPVPHGLPPATEAKAVGDVLVPDPFTYPIFEIFNTHGIKE